VADHRHQQEVTMSRTRRVAAGGALSSLALGVLGLTAPTASADPVNGNTSTVEVACTDGASYEVTATDGSAQFAAAHDLGSTATLIPLAWGLAHIELRSIEDGSLIAAFDEDWGGTKGASAHQPGARTCTASLGGVEDVPDLGEVAISVTIPLTVVVTPR
jgi:hypothetical protein